MKTVPSCIWLLLGLGMGLCLPGCRQAAQTTLLPHSSAVSVTSVFPPSTKAPAESEELGLTVKTDHALSPPGSPDVEPRAETDTQELGGTGASVQPTEAGSPFHPTESDPNPCPVADSAEPDPPASRLRPLCRALEAYLEDRPDLAVDLLGAYPQRDQEVLLRLLPIVARVDKGGLFSGASSDEERLTVLETLRALVQEIQVEAPLVIAKATFCREIYSFGRGELHGTDHFRAGDRAAVYLEIQNLADQKTDDERYVARLASNLTIQRGERVIKSLPVQNLPDWSWSPRHDHFNVIRFQFPRDLEPGLYLLTVSLTDEATGRQARKQLPFRIVSVTTSGKRP